MLSKAKNWIGVGKPKNQHSLENLKYLYTTLNKNLTVNDSNKDLLIENLRSISEILIWGDQNDASVFDFFLEKQMITFFLRYMKQTYGRYICVQLLQTLNILFENISNQTSLYYLLSNNHINNIIIHKFDFTDEEVMAYYISFLKTLSLKLNHHSIHFFYNERTNEFPLYIEAIKFFDHPEAMVRIAVRTITLNVYRVSVSSMIEFIAKKTAKSYYSNLIWLLRNLVLDLNIIIIDMNEFANKSKFIDLMEEFLDQINYIQDIFELNLEILNVILQDELMKRFIIPICITSLCKINNRYLTNIHASLAIFLLTRILSIIKYKPIIDEIIITLSTESDEIMENLQTNLKVFLLAPISMNVFFSNNSECLYSLNGIDRDTSSRITLNTGSLKENTTNNKDEVNITDDEKCSKISHHLFKKTKSIFSIIISQMDIEENDFTCLLSLCLFCIIEKSENKIFCNILEDKELSNIFQKKLLNIIINSVDADSKIRLVTLEICVEILINIYKTNKFLENTYLLTIEKTINKSIGILQKILTRYEIFLDVFEHEYVKYMTNNIKVELLLRDHLLVIKPTSNSLSGLEFSRRYPSGENEKIKFMIRTFFIIRKLFLVLNNETEKHLPLRGLETIVKENDSLYLNNSDLIACTINTKERKERRFMVIDPNQIILVEPEVKRIGFGIVKFSNLLENVEVNPDKEDSRSLHIKVKSQNITNDEFELIINAKFTYDDHIRCMAAKQHLLKARERIRRLKLEKLAEILMIVSFSNKPEIKDI